MFTSIVAWAMGKKRDIRSSSGTYSANLFLCLCKSDIINLKFKPGMETGGNGYASP